MTVIKVAGLRTCISLMLLAMLTVAASAQSPRSFPSFPGLNSPDYVPEAPQGYPGAGYPGGARSPVCTRLESQLATFDRSGGYDLGRADQIRRFEDAASRQQAELARMTNQSRRLSCDSGGFFSLFSGQNPQCESLTNQIQQMRGNLDRILADLERLRSRGGNREGQRRGLLAALEQNDCGPQYRNAANSSDGYIDNLVGPGTIIAPEVDPNAPQSGTYRTVCVRTCDGYYFPISFQTVPGRFAEDERTCQRMCPASEVQLYAHRNPGEDMNQATSINGQPYTALPNAFRYRQQFNSACSCRANGQSWADAIKAMGNDDTVEQGDIVVTEDRAQQLSQPSPVQSRPTKQNTAATPRNPVASKAALPPPASPTMQTTQTPPAQKAASTTDTATTASGKIRSVGPTFIPSK